jgi:hypothetical protein
VRAVDRGQIELRAASSEVARLRVGALAEDNSISTLRLLVIMVIVA